MSYCVLCGKPSTPLGAVDFNRGCLSSLPPCDEPIDYERCPGCGLIYAPGMCTWTKEQFRTRVYNGEYPLVDPEIAGERARRNASWMEDLFAGQPISHLDYGGGDGTLSRLLRERGWDSTSYDPLEGGPLPDRTFDLVTAFEVFEHAPDPHALLADLRRVSRDVAIFSTVLSDAVTRPLDWWYLAPRNGHVVLYNKQALGSLLRRGGFHVLSFDGIAHFAYRGLPKWLEAAVS